MWKQVIVVRKDLKMGAGKTAAQVAHASLGAYKNTPQGDRLQWDSSGAKKVVLKVHSLKELMDVHALAKRARLPCALIKDAGLTEVEPGTITALGIGPCREADLDRITGALKML